MKKILSLVFAAVAVMTAFGQTNLALNKSAQATSGNAAAAVDGNIGSRWESQHSDPQTWIVDLGESMTFNAVRIVWEGAYGKTFDILVGDEVDADGYLTDGEAVVSIEGQTLTGFPNYQVFEFTAVTKRYVQFNGIARGTQWGYSFYEFGVYNLEAPLSLASLELKAASTQTNVTDPVALTLTARNQLNAIVEAADVEYVLSNPSVGAVANGQFVPAAAGTTTIKAKVGDIESNEVSITVVSGEKIDLFTDYAVRIYNLGIATNASKAGAFDNNTTGSEWAMRGGGTGDDEASRTYDVGFIADLRGIYDVTSVSITFEGACSQDFTLSFAGEDGIFGEPTYIGGTHVYGINGHTENFEGETVTNARYVKFFSTKAATMYDVKIFNFAVNGILKQAVEDAVAPVLSAAAAGEVGEESVTIKATATDNSSKYLAYEVQYTKGEKDVTVLHAIGETMAGEEASLLIDGLNGHTTYNFSVVAIDAFGNRSEAETVEATTTGDLFILTPAPAPQHDAANVKSIYSDAYEPVTPIFDGGWGQSTVREEVTVDGDHISLFTRYNYFGFGYGTSDQASVDVDLSDMDYVHVDLLPMAAMSIGITPIMRNGTGATERSTNVGALTVKQWNSIDMPLSAFAGMDFTSGTNFQFKFDGGSGNEVFYMDNLYFYKSGDEPQPQPAKALYVFGVEGATPEQGVQMTLAADEISYNLDIVVTDSPVVLLASTPAYSDETAVGVDGEEWYLFTEDDVNRQLSIVDGGQGITLSPGNYHLTAARWFDSRDFLIITPQNVPVCDVMITDENDLPLEELTLEAGQSAQLNAYYAPSYATGNPVIEWSSDDETVATVVDGFVTAIAPASGAPRRAPAMVENRTANIMATAGNFTATLPLTVTDPSTGVTDLSVNAAPVSVKYVNAMGQVSNKAFDGVNIVVTKYNDGTQKTTKVVF